MTKDRKCFRCGEAHWGYGCPKDFKVPDETLTHDKPLASSNQQLASALRAMARGYQKSTEVIEILTRAAAIVEKSPDETTPESAPFGWYRGFSSPGSPIRLPEYGWEAYVGEDPPSAEAGWLPFYREARVGLANAQEWHRLCEAIATILEVDSNADRDAMGRQIADAIQRLRDARSSVESREMPAPPLCDGEVRVIYEHGQPKGVRDTTGYLCFFNRVNKYDGQEDRYRNELALRARQAEVIAAALRGAVEPKPPHTTENDFQHWLSYSGKFGHDEAAMRAAYYAGANAAPPAKASGEYCACLQGVCMGPDHTDKLCKAEKASGEQS